MGKIVLTRIDDRLIHGQVMTAWVKVTKAERIIVIDDQVAKDDFMIQVLKMAVPNNIKAEVYSIADAANVLSNGTDSDVIILAKYPKTIYELVKKGVQIKALNIGGMGAKEGRKKFFKNISASKEEIEIFKKLLEEGINVMIQIIPDEKITDVRTLIK